MKHLLRVVLAVVVVAGFARIAAYCAAPEGYGDEQALLRAGAAENARAVGWGRQADRLAAEGVPVARYAGDVQETFARGDDPAGMARMVRERYAAAAID